MSPQELDRTYGEFCNLEKYPWSKSLPAYRDRQEDFESYRMVSYDQLFNEWKFIELANEDDAIDFACHCDAWIRLSAAPKRVLFIDIHRVPSGATEWGPL